MPRDIEPGDRIVTKPRVLHLGEDIGDRLGKVICTTGYILVEIDEYHSNPVKCFRYEVDLIDCEKLDATDEEVQDFFSNLANFGIP
jgi:hypothetical protein